MVDKPYLDKHHQRCPWCGFDPLYIKYHDEVWGVPEYDSKALFGKLILDGAQAGLSWITILRRQEGYFDVFDGLDPAIVAHYTDQDRDRLMQDARIIRNRLKIDAAITNARAYIALEEKGVSFSDYLWGFMEGKTLHNEFKSMAQLPAQTPLSQKISKELKNKGFKFVGPTIIYAFMQAVGMVNDHLLSCYRHQEIRAR
jgi:DNA-3-methyladenine glycosylase I